MYLIGELLCVPCCLMLWVVRVQLDIYDENSNRQNFSKLTFVSFFSLLLHFDCVMTGCIVTVRHYRKNLSGERDKICLFFFIDHWMTVCLYSHVDRYPFDAQYTHTYIYVYNIIVCLSISKLQKNDFFLASAFFCNRRRRTSR